MPLVNQARSMLCHLLQKIAVKGWRVVLSTDATSCVVKSDDRKDHPQVGYHENWYHDSSVNIFILFLFDWRVEFSI